MGQVSFAVDKPAIAASQGGIILPFNARRRVLLGLSSATQPRLSEGLVVRFPLATVKGRQKAPRMEEGITKRRPDPSNSNETQFTPLDFVVTAFLILSAFAGPALVWTLASAASLG
jgi:hypothetical protein